MLYVRWALAAVFAIFTLPALALQDSGPELRRLLAAAQPGSTVKLAPGEYWLAVNESGTALDIPSGVTLDARGATIRLIENTRPGYFMISMAGRDSHLLGGTIIGDRDKHLGTTGEWGMCIGVRGARNVSIKGVTVTNCWGDGIYVGAAPNSIDPSRDVTIEDVEAVNNRRNNISIVAVIGFKLSKVRALRANGTPPQAGIDLEPGEGEIVSRGVLSDIEVSDNAGRGLVFAGSEGELSNIRLDRVRASGNAGAGFWLKAATGVTASNLTATGNGWHGLMLTRMRDFGLYDYSGARNWRKTEGVADIFIDGSERVHMEKALTNGFPVTQRSPLISIRKSSEVTFR